MLGAVKIQTLVLHMLSSKRKKKSPPDCGRGKAKANEHVIRVERT